MSKKEYRKAFDRAAQQIASAPNNPFLYGMLGSLYEANKDVNNAEVYMKKAIDLNPGLPALQVSLANFYMRQNMVVKAKNEYLAAVQKAPDSLPAHMALGMIYESEKDYDKAKGYYLKALQINPNFAPAANNLAYIYAERKGTSMRRSTWHRKQKNRSRTIHMFRIPWDGSITRRTFRHGPSFT